MHKVKKSMLYLIKILLAVLVAFILANAICFFYYSLPGTVSCSNHATDYTLIPGTTGFVGDEGYAELKVDSNGYNNQSVPDRVDILSMGSSHTLGYNVAPDENYSVLLGQKLADAGLSDDVNVYNIGMWYHYLPRSLRNLQAACEAYKPSRYVIVETPTIIFSDQELSAYLNDDMDVQKPNSRLLLKLKKMPYVALALHQLKNYMSNAGASTTADNNAEVKNTEISEESQQDGMTGQMLDKAETVCRKNNVRLIIMYHPQVCVDHQGQPYTEVTKEERSRFQSECEKRNIILCDMTDTFEQEYQQKHILPDGFNNTTPGTGHLNKYGHRMIAEKLYEMIQEGEK